MNNTTDKNKAAGAATEATGAETGVPGVNTPAAGENAAEAATGPANVIQLATPAPDEAKEDVGVYLHKFGAPFEYEGRAFEEIAFDFSRLTGRDMISIETEMQGQNEFALAPEISRSFQCKMAAKAARVEKFGADVLEAMPIKDFNRITNAARRFLLDTGY